MSERMTVWGVGPKFTLFSVLYLALMLTIHYASYPLFVMRGIPYALLIVAGILLLAVGVPIWVMASKEVDRAFEGGYLATQGVYALCRHPAYGNAIFFTIPGILLLFRSWLLLTVPVAMYIIFRLLIGKEEAYLRQVFSQAYLAYASEVNAAFPRFWKLRSAFWYPVPTGKVAEHEYAVTAGDASMFIYTDGAHAIAIDASYGGEALRQELQRIPIDPASVTHLFLTHGDVDHTGGLDLFPNAHVYLSQDEEQMIDGSVPRMLGLYHSPRLERPYTLLADGDHGCVGAIEFRAIATPGHTPGSMSYLINGHVLFTGDTLALRNGRVRTFYRLINMDTAAQQASTRKLARLEKVSLLCTSHTGCTTDYALAMKDWREMRYLQESKGVGAGRLARYWGRLAEVYDDSTLLAGGTYPPIVEKLRGEFHPEDKLLDVGAGTGSLTIHIAPLVGHVTCTDIAPEMIEKAKVRLHSFGDVVYGVEDARALSLEDNSFDVVLCCNVLHQLSRPARALREFRRVLRPGGKLLAITLCMGHMSVWAKLRTAVEYVIRFGIPPAGSPFTLSSFARLIAEAGFDVKEAVLVTEKPFPTSYVSAIKPQSGSAWIDERGLG